MIKPKRMVVRIIIFSMLLSGLVLDSALASGTTVIDSTGGLTCKNGPYTGGNYAQQFIAGTSATITSINILIGSGSTAYFLNSSVKVLADNSQLPGTLLATFSPFTTSGGLAYYSGSLSITSGTKFWIFPTYSTGNTSWCYAYPSSDTTQVTYLSGWTNAYSGTISNMYFNLSSGNGTSWGSTGISTFLMQLQLVINGNASASSIVLRNMNTATYRQVQTIYADLGVAGSDGYVTFSANGKPIPGCRSILSSSLVASCTWKPATHGTTRLSARLNPSSSSFLASNSSLLNVVVVQRFATR